MTLDWKTFLRDKKLSIIVPVFNEGKNIESNLRTLMLEVEPFFSDFEVIVVSDGSTDETNEKIKHLQHPKIRSVIYVENRGKGFVLRKSFEQANGDFVFFIDGGMELHPKEIRIFLALQAIYDADIVVGSKRHPQSEVYYPFTRRILSLLYQALIQVLFQLRVTDTQVGLKLIRKEVIKATIGELKTDGYAFDLELLLKARQKGFKTILEAPIRLDYFTKRERSLIAETTHVLKIGTIILIETIRIYVDYIKNEKYRSRS